VVLPPTEKLELRTAQPTQEMKHLRRLASEQLSRARLSAPATDLRLRSLETVPWGGTTVSLLPEENRPGEKLHQLVERLSVRLGADNVTCEQPVQDHRPERMQRWVAARESLQAPVKPDPQAGQDDLLPSWLLRDPLKLQVKAEKPCYHGPLQLVSRARRLEAGWWDQGCQQPVVRDYFIARSEEVGLLWIYRERLAADQAQPRWFLHGIYA
jgi:protein ImuB